MAAHEYTLGVQHQVKNLRWAYKSGIDSEVIWKDFVKRWRMVDITRLGVPNSTVAEWRAGKKEPKKYHRDALEFWIDAKAGKKVEVPRHPKGEAGK
jgi:hypothetical protein